MDQRGETAVCATANPEVWFPQRGVPADAAVAKRLCRSCPLIDPCREWALAYPTAARYGVWGGLSERERRAERKRRARQRRSAVASTREAA
ncbi:MAG: WhiB family transcriptional regulator [Streptosporangiales bacterium]|nr:WhiB family transcriptional regulator [Streptosporangiales bacterium]